MGVSAAPATCPPDSLLAEADLYGPRWAMVGPFQRGQRDRLELPATEA